MRAFASALSYFTIVPLRLQSEAAPPAAVLFGYLPFVGLLIGGSAGTAAYLLSKIAPEPLAIAAAFAIPIVLTGALHVDGFLDSCDALFACVTPQRRLEIMKDPHHGTFAVAYFVVLCVVWIAALAALPMAKLPLVIAFACGNARWSAILSAFRFPYARGGRPSVPAVIAGGLTVALVAHLLGGWFWLAMPAVASLEVAAGLWSSRRLGGVLVGDVYGGLIVCGEVASLALCAVAAIH
jgi:adenosylcobinamide-GDP ribazoletransferase